MSDLEIQRLVVSRLIAAENDYQAAQAEYWAAFKREFGMLGIPRYQMPFAVAKFYSAAWFNLQWARRDYQVFTGNYAPHNEPYNVRRDQPIPRNLRANGAK